MNQIFDIAFTILIADLVTGPLVVWDLLKDERKKRLAQPAQKNKSIQETHPMSNQEISEAFLRMRESYAVPIPVYMESVHESEPVPEVYAGPPLVKAESESPHVEEPLIIGNLPKGEAVQLDIPPPPPVGRSLESEAVQTEECVHREMQIVIPNFHEQCLDAIIRQGKSYREAAKELGRPHSSIQKEVKLHRTLKCNCPST